MGRRDDNGNSTTLPPRIKAAFDFLNHAYYITTQTEASIPARDLSPLEKSVEMAALRALQQYLLGEMDFVENSPPPNQQGVTTKTAPRPHRLTVGRNPDYLPRRSQRINTDRCLRRVVANLVFAKCARSRHFNSLRNFSASSAISSVLAGGKSEFSETGKEKYA